MQCALEIFLNCKILFFFCFVLHAYNENIRLPSHNPRLHRTTITPPSTHISVLFSLLFSFIFQTFILILINILIFLFFSYFLFTFNLLPIFQIYFLCYFSFFFWLLFNFLFHFHSLPFLICCFTS